MADDDDTGTTGQTDDDASAPTPGDPEDHAGGMPDAVKAVLAKERAAAKAAEKRAKDAETRLKRLEDRDKSEAEKLSERATAAEQRADALERDLVRNRVALEKGIPPELAARLQGTTEAELAADADALLKIVRRDPRPGSFDGGARGGHGGTTEPVDKDPRVALGKGILDHLSTLPGR